MKFAFREPVAVPPARALAAYGTPAFYEGRPERDDIAVKEVVRHEETATGVLIEVRYAFTGSVSPAVRAVIQPDKMSWITRTEILPDESRTAWVVLPDHYPDRLTASGGFRFEPGSDGPASTVIAVDGELEVHVPIVGRSVERVIVADLKSYLVDEVATIPGLP
ncbi:MAG TPA: DUF2505 family protein [Acidimicrobiales bacterium]|nr:DUF2505 family protein [Acidimicrobiales bacterium]